MSEDDLLCSCNLDPEIRKSSMRFSFKVWSMALAVSGILLTQAWCTAKAPNPGAQVFGKIPATLAKNWDTSWRETSLSERIRPIDPIGIAYVAKWNELDGFDEKPQPAELTPERRAALIKELENLPPYVKKFLEGNIAAIFTTRELGGSAMAGVAYNDSMQPEFGFLFLDTEMFETPANEWITAKEQTLFAPEAGKTFSIQIEEPGSNTSAAGMRFILLHELGHVASQLSHTMPPFTEEHLSLNSHFAKLSWTTPVVTRFDAEFPERGRVKFYRRPPPFPMSAAKDIYAKLAKTDLPTLYACVDPHEDFAETFALYIHTVLMKKPYTVRLIDSSGEQVLARDRILLQALQKKRETIQGLLNNGWN
ncbi:MAG: hypothetical protein JNM27_10145 [Leptospirales bacterium]|nr:hypothetical protein [Leptospirales bacterium]